MMQMDYYWINMASNVNRTACILSQLCQEWPFIRTKMPLLVSLCRKTAIIFRIEFFGAPAQDDEKKIAFYNSHGQVLKTVISCIHFYY